MEYMPSTERASAYENSGRTGFVYVLGSRLLTDPKTGTPILKIGATRKHPLQRMAELNAATGVPEPMDLLYYHDFVDSFSAERMTHAHFEHARINESREFFCVPITEAVSFIAGLCNSSTYREVALESVGIEGGEYREKALLMETPWACLFNTFDDRGDGVLNAEERAKCRALEERLRNRR